LDKLAELKDILKTVGPQNIWRPVVVNADHLLADGIGEAGDGLAENTGNLDFKGKTVLDLGCNFGYYSFLARSAGARRVLGIDADARIIRGCEIITALNGVDRVAFLAIDIVKAEGIGKFDIGLMIDLIGRQMIRTGTAKAVLDSLESLSEKEMVLTLRPRYHIPKKLAGDFQGLKEKYPASITCATGSKQTGRQPLFQRKMARKWNTSRPCILSEERPHQTPSLLKNSGFYATMNISTGFGQGVFFCGQDTGISLVRLRIATQNFHHC
jgi:hypothetical protein